MSNALVIQNEFNNEQLALITATVAKGATKDELNLFLYRCKHMGLDPLKPGQIHFVKFGNNPGTIVVGIEGFRSKASSTGKHNGTKRGVIRDNNGKCLGAWAEVYRLDWTHPARVEVSLGEFFADKPIWKKMPEAMIQKVAEVHALRMAFPDDLGGVYSDDEMDQASAQVKDVQPIENPFKKEDLKNAEADELKAKLPYYVVSFGKYKGQALKDVDMFELDNYVKWVINSAKDKGKEIKGEVKDFVEHAEAYLCSLEVQSEPEGV